MSAKASKGLPRVGIYAGTFDPVHAGHVAFALQAVQAAKLDRVVFMPERQPRYKPGVEHYAHRVAMLRQALRPHPALSLMEMVERNYSVARTLPRLRRLFPGCRLVFLAGSDMIASLPQWPGAEVLLSSCELVVGVRSQHLPDEVTAAIAAWPRQPRNMVVVPSFAPDISSSDIRSALRTDKAAKGLLPSVSRYARREWLYVSPGAVLAKRLAPGQ